MKQLPLVLLGKRTALKEHIGSCAAELVYGTTLRLPGQFFQPIAATAEDTSAFVIELRETMSKLRPSTPGSHAKNKTFYVSKDLQTCTHVFIRHDAVGTPLQQPYDGPYEVMNRSAKYYKININGRLDNVSIDRLNYGKATKQQRGDRSNQRNSNVC